ncbi:MAG: putative sulfate exporter family transporter [Pirellulaceae bacterium]|nr:putative sulfate exporter family transporter [Pirellulaceae bacterium]
MSEPAPSSQPTVTGLSEDWSAVILGVVVFLLALGSAWLSVPDSFTWRAEKIEPDTKWLHPIKPVLGSGGSWSHDLRQGLWNNHFELEKGQPPKTDKTYWPGLVGAAVLLTCLGGVAAMLRGYRIEKFLLAFPAIFLLGLLAMLMAKQATMEALGLEYVMWAVLLGLLISNTIGTPAAWRPAVMAELYIKLGLVLLGAEVLLGALVAYGLPGIVVAWVVTPTVLISTYMFGQYILKMPSRTLNIVISADMSVCGVSAAIATAAACRAKRDELSLAIGLSLAFTMAMMIVMPHVCNWLGLSPVVAGAWIGGTIDSTGAVAAAGTMVGKEAGEVAVTIKMIQNTLIGVVALAVATYWTTVIEPRTLPAENQATEQEPNRPDHGNSIGVFEIWRRFPKFIIGFLAVSLIASWIVEQGAYEALWLKQAVQEGVTKPLRGWLFCLGFVCIGLDSNLRLFVPYLRTGKPVILYAVGQSLNLLLTLAMAYLMFEVLFPNAVDIATKGTP